MRYDKIIVPLDGSQLAEYILPHVETMVSRFYAELTLLHVVNTADGATSEMTRSQKDARANITGYLEKVSNALSEKHIQSEWEIRYGDPVEEIAKYATEHEADLIMMSTHGQGANGREKMGSVSTAIVSKGDTPVMVIRPPEKVALR